MSSPSQAQPRAIPQQIVIDYNANPPGQVGIRPQRVSRNNTFVFTQKDPGTLTIEFLGKSLDIGDFDKASLDSCKVDGKLYGINIGNNSNAYCGRFRPVYRNASKVV